MAFNDDERPSRQRKLDQMIATAQMNITDLQKNISQFEDNSYTAVSHDKRTRLQKLQQAQHEVDDEDDNNYRYFDAMPHEAYGSEPRHQLGEKIVQERIYYKLPDGRSVTEEEFAHSSHELLNYPQYKAPFPHKINNYFPETQRYPPNDSQQPHRHSYGGDMTSADFHSEPIPVEEVPLSFNHYHVRPTHEQKRSTSAYGRDTKSYYDRVPEAHSIANTSSVNQSSVSTIELQEPPRPMYTMPPSPPASSQWTPIKDKLPPREKPMPEKKKIDFRQRSASAGASTANEKVKSAEREATTKSLSSPIRVVKHEREPLSIMKDSPRADYNPCEHLYTQGLRQHLSRLELHQQSQLKKQQKDEEEAKYCTFKPKINNLQTHADSTDVFERMTHDQKKRQKELENLEKLKAENQVKQCTFKPSITHMDLFSSNSHPTNAKELAQRLYDEAFKKKDRGGYENKDQPKSVKISKKQSEDLVHRLVRDQELRQRRLEEKRKDRENINETKVKSTDKTFSRLYKNAGGKQAIERLSQQHEERFKKDHTFEPKVVSQISRPAGVDTFGRLYKDAARRHAEGDK